MSDLDDEVMKDLYSWVDQIPLSRPKKNISRDFSDGVMMAELMKHFFPHLVDMHNYPDCSSIIKKKSNWNMLNWKVFKRLNFELSEDVIDSIIENKYGTIERVLLLLRTKMDRSQFNNQRKQEQKTVNKKVLGKGKPVGNNVGNTSNRPGVGATGDKGQGVSTGYGNATRDRNAAETHQLLESDFVTQRDFDHKVHECMAKDETIEILQAKVRRLEHLIQLKDVRMDDLQRRIEEFSGGGPSTMQHHQFSGGPPLMMHPGMMPRYPPPQMHR